MAKYNQAMEDFLRYNAAILPQKRSTFNKSHGHTTTGDSGYIIPLTWDRVVPGDEKKIRYSGLVRMTTPFHPVMDEAKFDVACFFVPDRLVWDHAREFYGENKDASFNPDGMYVMPYLKPSQYGVMNDNSEDGIGSLSDYLGFPLIDHLSALEGGFDDFEELRCTGLLHRAYHLIYNYFYRNSSVQPAERLSTGDQITDEEWSVIKKLKLACKFPDYFTSLLREPQAGDDVLLPLGEWAPVVARDVSVDSDLPNSYIRLGFADNSWGNGNFPLYAHYSQYQNAADLVANSANPGSLQSTQNVFAKNLWADLTNATSATINNLRAAITVQQLLEVDATAGKFYQKILQAHFGVFTPDGTLQQPELLGLCRQTVGMRQVLQTSATADGTTPLGDTAAFSLTSVSNEIICDRAFTEPGVIIVTGVIRPVHSYSQGLDPLLQKLNRYDHYWPVFDNLGNQPVYGRNIYCSTNGVGGYDEIYTHYDDVLGYAEAWTEYRIKNNRVSGLMRPDVLGTLASWNYSSNFDRTPVLNSEFVEEDPMLIDRTIAVENQPQFLIDSYFDYYDTKNMSVHSIPGITRL